MVIKDSGNNFFKEITEMKLKIISSAVLFFSFCALLSGVTVAPEKAIIVVDKNADGTVQFAAVELQKYLHWITGRKIVITDKRISGKYPFIFGTPEGVSLKPEEARWEVTKEYTRLYGDSTRIGTPRIQLWKILAPRTKSGDLTAVYDFLEKQLSVLFLAPGRDGVSYEKSKVLNLKEGTGRWLPPFAYRQMWPDRASWHLPGLYEKNGTLKAKRKNSSPAEFMPPSASAFVKKEQETEKW